MIETICPLCKRPVPDDLITDHHLIPQSKGGKDKEALCRACHNQIHLLFTNRELECNLNTVAKLKDHSRMKGFIKWISKRPIETIPSRKESKRRKGKR